MTYARKTLSEIKLIRGNFGDFIRFQDTKKIKEKKYKEPPYKDLTMNPEKVDEESLNEKCWPGYEKKGMKTMFGKRYPNCVKKKKTRKEEFSDWRSDLNVDEATLTKSQIKKRDEIADAISNKEMIDRYGDKNIKYAIATNKVKELVKDDYLPEVLDKKDVPHVKKLIKKLKGSANAHEVQAKELEVALNTEDTAIESELVIQDWNSDDIKFTEIETVDIIKAKPLKENYSDWKNDLVELDEKFQFLKHAFGKTIIRATGADKAMGKFPRLSSKAVNTFIQNRSKIVLDTFKNKLNKLKYDRIVKSADDVPTKFRDPKVIGDKKINPNAVFPPVAQSKIKNEILTDITNKNTNIPKIVNKSKVKKIKKDLKDHYDWRADLGEDWQKVNRKDKTDGMSQKAVDAYKRENPGSNLKTAVTGKVKKGSKASKRRRSFCARSDGQRKMHNIDCKKTPNKRICKARRRWKC